MLPWEPNSRFKKSINVYLVICINKKIVYLLCVVLEKDTYLWKVATRPPL